MTDFLSTDPTAPEGIRVKVEPGWPSLSQMYGHTDLEPVRVRLGNVDIPAVFQMDISQSEPEVRLVSLLFRADPDKNEVSMPMVVCMHDDVDAGLRWVREMKPLADWKAVALMHLTWSAFESATLKPAGKNIEDLTSENHEMLATFQSMVESLGAVAVRRRRRNSVTDELLAEVAEVYRAAVSKGAPTEAVKEHFHISHSTATRYVRLAREAKHLGPANGSRAGELL